MNILWKAGALAAVAGYVCLQNSMPELTGYEIFSDKIPAVFDGFRIVQLSDLHNKSFGTKNEDLIDAVDVAAPDCIVMTGDMVNRSDTNYDKFLSMAQSLAKKYPIYYILGNHEQRLPKNTQAYILEKLTQIGVTVLNNEKKKIEKEQESITISGVTCPLKYYKYDDESRNSYFTVQEVEKRIGICESGFQILLSHNPLYFSTYAKWGADLTFCGHVHGGAVRLPFVGGLLSPEREFFPRYSEGEYTIRNKKMIVSRGLGDFRVFNRPELPLITLHSKPKEE